MQAVLEKYRHVYNREGSDFQGTDLVEHKIITGDRKPIRKPTYRVPIALRKEMNNKIQYMLNIGIIEETSSPWSSSAILVPKKSQDGKLN